MMLQVNQQQQESIQQQIRIERLLKVRQQTNNNNIKKIKNYNNNKIKLKNEIKNEKCITIMNKNMKCYEELDKRLHNVLMDSGTGHDGAEYYQNYIKQKDKKMDNKKNMLLKKHKKYYQIAYHCLQEEKMSQQQHVEYVKHLVQQREEQSLLERERAHMRAESMAAKRVLLEKSKRQDDALKVKSRHDVKQDHSEQGAVSILQRGKVIVQARVTRHGTSYDYDKTIVTNEKENFKDELNKKRKDNVMKELVSKHVVKSRNQLAKKATMDNSIFTNIENSFAYLSSMDRSDERRNRLKNVEDIERKNTQQKDTRLSGGSGRNPVAYSSFVRKSFENDFFNTNMTTRMNKERSGDTEHVQYSWKKPSERSERVSKKSIPQEPCRKALTDTNLKKKKSQQVDKKVSKATTSDFDKPAPQWKSINPVAQPMSSGLIGQQTLIPTQVASFLTQEDPYLGIGADVDSSVTTSLSSIDEDNEKERNLYELFARMEQESNARVNQKGETDLQDYPSFNLKEQQVRSNTEDIKTSPMHLSEEKPVRLVSSVQASIVRGDVSEEASELLSQSSGTSSGDDSKRFQYVFEYDAVHSHSQPPSVQSLSPSKDYVPAQSLHEPAGDIRKDLVGSRAHLYAFPLGNHENNEEIHSQHEGISSEVKTTNRQWNNQNTPGFQDKEYVDEGKDRSVTMESVDLSDDSLRCDPCSDCTFCIL